MFRRRDPCVLSIRALCPLVFIVAASPLSSANTARVVVRLGSTDYLNSNTSEILTSFIGHAGAIEYI